MSIESHLEALKGKHTALDEQIQELESGPAPCQVEVRKLKKAKLLLKEQIQAAQKKQEETSEPDRLEVAGEEPKGSTKKASLPVHMRHHNFDEPVNGIDSFMGRVPETVAKSAAA